MRNYIAAGLFLAASALSFGLSGCATDGYGQKGGKKWNVRENVAGYGTFAEHDIGEGDMFSEATGTIDGNRIPDYIYATGEVVREWQD